MTDVTAAFQDALKKKTAALVQDDILAAQAAEAAKARFEAEKKSLIALYERDLKPVVQQIEALTPSKEAVHFNSNINFLEGGKATTMRLSVYLVQAKLPPLRPRIRLPYIHISPIRLPYVELTVTEENGQLAVQSYLRQDGSFLMINGAELLPTKTQEDFKTVELKSIAEFAAKELADWTAVVMHNENIAKKQGTVQWVAARQEKKAPTP